MGEKWGFWGQWRQIHLSRRQGEKIHTFQIAQGLSNVPNEPLEPKGPVVTSEAKHHPMGVNPYSTLKRTRKPLEEKTLKQILTPWRKLSTLLVILTHWVNSYIRLINCG
jgi:hypothetical protein